MIRKPVTFPSGQPLTRTMAAEVVQTASRFESRVMISRHQKIVNAKSTLGLLSLSVEDQNDMVLVVEGPDEQEAAEAILALLK